MPLGGEYMDKKYIRIRYCPTVEHPARKRVSELYGPLGDLWPLKPDFGEMLLSQCSEPEIVLKRYIEDIDEWRVCDKLSISIYYPGGSRQTCLIVIEYMDKPSVSRDYYQIPYDEISTRTMLLFKAMNETCPDEKWFVAQVNNVQLAEWMEDWGIIQQSEKTIQEMTNGIENIRNKHSRGVEQRQERTGD